MRNPQHGHAGYSGQPSYNTGFSINFHEPETAKKKVISDWLPEPTSPNVVPHFPIHRLTTFNLARILVVGDQVYSLYTGKNEMVFRIDTRHIQVGKKNYLHNGAVIPGGDCVLFPNAITMGWERFTGLKMKIVPSYESPDFDLTKILCVGEMVWNMQAQLRQKVIALMFDQVILSRHEFDMRGRNREMGVPLLYPTRTNWDWENHQADFGETDDNDSNLPHERPGFSLKGFFKKGSSIYSLISSDFEKVVAIYEDGFTTNLNTYTWRGTKVNGIDCVVFPDKTNRDWTTWFADKV